MVHLGFCASRSSRKKWLLMKKQQEKLGLKELVAMGVGGMVGGGIFSVLGLAVSLAGHAALWRVPLSWVV